MKDIIAELGTPEQIERKYGVPKGTVRGYTGGHRSLSKIPKLFFSIMAVLKRRRILEEVYSEAVKLGEKR